MSSDGTESDFYAIQCSNYLAKLQVRNAPTPGKKSHLSQMQGKLYCRGARGSAFQARPKKIGSTSHRR